jgi:hypothetical protein
LRYQRQVRGARFGRHWPDYHGLFSNLGTEQRAAADPADREVLQRLALGLAEQFCHAPDYPDQLLGIENKTRLLKQQLAAAGLPPTEHARLAAGFEEFRRALSAFPHPRISLRILTTGVFFNETPEIPLGGRYEGPYLWWSADGTGMWGDGQVSW